MERSTCEVLKRLRLEHCKHVEPVAHGFVKVTCGKADAFRRPMLKGLLCDDTYKDKRKAHFSFYVDTRSGQLYGDMPELIRCGTFEIAYSGGFLCTRTKRCYRVKGRPEYLLLSQNGLYLPLSYLDTPANAIVDRMIVRYPVFQVCQLKGDDSQVYWLLGRFADDSVLVMDDNGEHYYVWLNKCMGEATKRRLGKVYSEADRTIMRLTLRDIDAEVAGRMANEGKMAKREAAQKREKEMQQLKAVVPFCVGGKWGLRQEGRIIVSPIYRIIQAPVGRYCAFERDPRQWGVLAIDGKVEVPARYEHVELFPDGRAELTVFSEKVISMKLGE